MTLRIQGHGRLVADPELKTVGSSRQVANMRIAAHNKKGKDGKSEALFIDVEAWEDLGVNCAAELRKGDTLVVVGRLQEDSWTNKEGEGRKKSKITADDVAKAVSRWPEDQPAGKPEPVEDAW